MLGDARLAELGEAISDGTPIDWERVGSSESDAERAILRELKVVADIVQLRPGAADVSTFGQSGVATALGESIGDAFSTSRLGAERQITENLFVSVKHHEVPWIGFERRVEVESLDNDCWQVTLHFGFKNEPDVPDALKLLEQRGVHLDEMETSYFLSRDIVIPTIGSGMALWREKLFASMHRNAAAAADFLHLPTNRIVELGSKVEI